jgi:DNA polymerase-3 subunit epsilon
MNIKKPMLSGHPLTENDDELAAMAAALVRSGNYRILRRLTHRPISPTSADPICPTAVILDVETTGLDHRSDEVLELAMVKFAYYPDGSIAGLSGAFAAFNEPAAPIPPDITTLTRITDEMVAGHRIDEVETSLVRSSANVLVSMFPFSDFIGSRAGSSLRVASSPLRNVGPQLVRNFDQISET